MALNSLIIKYTQNLKTKKDIISNKTECYIYAKKIRLPYHYFSRKTSIAEHRPPLNVHFDQFCASHI